MENLNVIKMSNVTPDEAAKVIAVLKKLIGFGKLVSAITPTEFDDKVIAMAEKVLLMVEPFAADPALVELLNFVLGLFANGKAPDVSSIRASS